MHPARVAVLVASVLLTASLAGLGIGFAVTQENEAPVQAAGADEALLHHGMAGDHATSQPGMARPAFPVSEGAVPTASDASALEEAHHLQIVGDDAFTPSNGVRTGSGTLADPYVISGYYVPGDLYLGDTDACVEIVGNYIAGQLSLNWNGQCVFVHHNYINDLRVNENVPRDGYATGGLLEQNKIGIVGQLRHYDGEFRHNVVGPRPAGGLFDTVLETVPFPWFEDPRIANVDGFNQGLIHHNTFYGSVDLDFHGHHHGEGFFSPHSHYHGQDEAKKAEHMDHEDHTDRWTSVAFTDNKVVDPTGYGLRYDDQAHAGDDRTANSEDEEALEMAHVHHVYVELKRNVIEDAPLWVDVFIADDDLHEKASEGWLDIEGNTVMAKEREQETLPFWGPYFQPSAAIQVYAAKESKIRIADNILAWEPIDQDPLLPALPLVSDWFYYESVPTAIELYGVRAAQIQIEGNTAQGFEVGVGARDFDEKVEWSVVGNDFGDVQQAVYYDESVANEPQTDE